MKHSLVVVFFTLIAILLLGNCKSSKMETNQKAKAKAAKLYEKGQKLEEKKEYFAAHKCYEKSLELHEEEEVRKAYLRLWATIGAHVI